MSEHYLDDKAYFRLVRKLAGSLGDVEAIKVELGRAGVWPESVRMDLVRSEALAEQVAGAVIPQLSRN